MTAKKKPAVIENDIIVGFVPGTNLHFIAVPKDKYEPIISPLSRKRYHSIRISRDNIEWLIGALKKELRLARATP